MFEKETNDSTSTWYTWNFGEAKRTHRSRCSFEFVILGQCWETSNGQAWEEIEETLNFYQYPIVSLLHISRTITKPKDHIVNITRQTLDLIGLSLLLRSTWQALWLMYWAWTGWFSLNLVRHESEKQHLLQVIVELPIMNWLPDRYRTYTWVLLYWDASGLSVLVLMSRFLLPVLPRTL